MNESLSPEISAEENWGLGHFQRNLVNVILPRLKPIERSPVDMNRPSMQKNADNKGLCPTGYRPFRAAAQKREAKKKWKT